MYSRSLSKKFSQPIPVVKNNNQLRSQVATVRDIHTVKKSIKDYYKNPSLYGPYVTLATKDSVEMYSTATGWNCLIISLGDTFGDGWDTAKLKITAPDGTSETYNPYCTSKNPLKFRYCPLSSSDFGLYYISMINQNDAIFNWEIMWKVQIQGCRNILYNL